MNGTFQGMNSASVDKSEFMVTVGEELCIVTGTPSNADGLVGLMHLLFVIVYLNFLFSLSLCMCVHIGVFTVTFLSLSLHLSCVCLQCYHLVVTPYQGLW